MFAIVAVVLVAILISTHGFHLPLRSVKRAIKHPMSTSGQSPALSATPTIEEWLEVAEPGLKKIILAMFHSCKEIASKIRSASCDKMTCFNDYGDEQLAIDILANNIIIENLKRTASVSTISSEESLVEDLLAGRGYSVAFNPLDGSSAIDTNLAVGSIFGVWPGEKLTSTTGRELTAAGIALYGPRTTVTLAVSNLPYAHEFLLVEGEWFKSNEFKTIDEGKIFAPGNQRAMEDNPGYDELFKYWIENTYQLRYTGGMVPDVNQLMVKGKGIFVHVASMQSKSKLYLLHGVAPVAYLIEKAGGKTSEGEMSVLDVLITNTEQVSQVAYGSPREVERFEELVGRKYI